MYTNVNNYMSMPTSQGSFAFTDFGANVSVKVNDNFHVGAQIYDRNIGAFGNWYPELDWAVADYKFKDWFGIRAGKVKTTLGLFNDTQDMEFLSTWALMPQSVYSLDQRGATISHEGGDFYGNPIPSFSDRITLGSTRPDRQARLHGWNGVIGLTAF
ncbi:MAG: hypothetical protein ABSD31_21310 [Candidatus Binataceae bacterium]|jgi:hypothetical protein